MRTSLLLVHRKPVVDSRFMRVLASDEVGGVLPEGLSPLHARVIRGEARIGGWSLPIKGDKILVQPGSTAGGSRLLRLQEADVKTLDQMDRTLGDLLEQERAMRATIQIFTSQAASRARRAVVKDLAK